MARVSASSVCTWFRRDAPLLQQSVPYPSRALLRRPPLGGTAQVRIAAVQRFPLLEKPPQGLPRGNGQAALGIAGDALLYDGEGDIQMHYGPLRGQMAHGRLPVDHAASRGEHGPRRAHAADHAGFKIEEGLLGELVRDALQAAKLRGDQWQEKAEARQARIQELESRPIQTTAMDSDEVNRLVAQRMEEELARQTPRRQEEQEQAARDAYDAFILTARSLDNLWKALKPQISRLAPEQKSGAENLLLQKLMEVKEELIHACENCQP